MFNRDKHNLLKRNSLKRSLFYSTLLIFLLSACAQVPPSSVKTLANTESPKEHETNTINNNGHSKPTTEQPSSYYPGKHIWTSIVALSKSIDSLTASIIETAVFSVKKVNATLAADEPTFTPTPTLTIE